MTDILLLVLVVDEVVFLVGCPGLKAVSPEYHTARARQVSGSQ